MEKPSKSIQELARRLLDLEAGNGAASEGNAAERVCGKLHTSLTRFAGAAGFLALTRRSLALARADVPSLSAINVDSGGCFEGLADLAGDDVRDAGGALISHFLWLLVTFVGEPIALQLMADTWPELKMDQ